MKLKDIVIGAVVVIILIAIAFWIKKNKVEKTSNLIVETPSVEEKVSKSFNGFTIPEGIERVELKDMSGGDLFGVATRDMVLADLPDLETGKYYQVFVDDKYLGNLKIAKGGYLYEGRIDGKKVTIKLGDKLFLEGSF